MTKQFNKYLILAAVLVAIIPVAIFSQDVAITLAMATVTTAITVTATSDLAFGTVLAGVPSSVPNNNANAGIFTINGQAGAGVGIFVQLPEYLSLLDGSSKLPISFSTTDASLDTTGDSDPTTMAGSKGWQNINPRNITGTAVIGAGGTNLYLGGKVTPKINQISGDYSGDIIVTVMYNGN